MIQTHVPHPSGTFPVCANCGREPLHIRATGSSKDEVFDVRHPTGERHALECHCAGLRRTPWCGSLARAGNQWRLHFAATDLPSGKASNVRPLLRLHKDTG